MSPSHRRTLVKKNSGKPFQEMESIEIGNSEGIVDQEMLEKRLAEELVLLAHEDGLQSVEFNQFGSPMGPTSMGS